MRSVRAMRTRPALAAFQRVAAVAGARHAERKEDALVHLVIEEVAGLGVDQIADQTEGHILVAVALTNAQVRFTSSSLRTNSS